MLNPTCIQPLETRRLFSFSITSGDPGTVIAFGPGNAAITFAPLGYTTRAGNFALPAISEQTGSAHLVGSADNDVIVVERVKGIHETVTNDKPVDGELDFFSFINADGTRTMGQYHQSMGTLNTEAIAGNEAAILEYEQYLADYRSRTDRDYSEEIAEQQYGLDHAKQQIAFLRMTPEKAANGDFIRYTLAGVFDYYVEVPAAISSKAKITVEGSSGSDKITVANNVPFKTSLFGGSGVDTLTSGKKATALFGGGGGDKLISRSTKGGTLDGGTGADRYFNQGGVDLNIAARKDGDQIAVGFTTFAVAQPGVFGNEVITLRAYYLVLDSNGPVDLLLSR